MLGDSYILALLEKIEVKMEECCILLVLVWSIVQHPSALGVT